MPVGELIGQYSRPVVDSEPWFPTQKGDWVFLDDKVYGRVENQTMEQVTLYNYASLKYYPTSDFLSQKPRNLSKGYRLVIKFGLDYGVQSRICDEIPKMFEEGLKNYLTYYYEKEPSVIESLRVNFESAGSSSLNLIILVKVNGLYGEDYYPLKWDVNKYLVKICNDNDLVIPFSQVTVSLSDDVKKNASQQAIFSPKPSDQKQI
ncbi:MAG: small-conductance mechanosensitive channel [Nitrospinales bacterium]|jgi:small-conductance mechanosensitive channel